MLIARLLPPEPAHRLALLALRAGVAGRDRAPDDPILRVEAFGRTLRNPVGLAAGFDKDAVAAAPLGRLGFGFVECGTATLRPQAGNPRPRLFRLPEDRAIINRMGMNNQGIGAFVRRLAATPRGEVAIGANVGINKQGAEPERDYPAMVAAVAPYADYVTINVSSPNTPGLRDLQGERRLSAILAAIRALELPVPPLFVKLAPDLAEEGLEAAVGCAIEFKIAGVIVSNTTVSRPPGLKSAGRGETGGLSGPPLFALSTGMLRRAARIAQGRLTLIGCGGVRDGATALAKIEAGATLVQLYTGFAYEGPKVIPKIKRELAALLRARGYKSVTEAVGAGL